MPDEFPYDVFLSHSAKDKAVVRPLAERLRKDGVKVWFDEWVLKPGDSIPAKIEEGLERSRVLVLCMSANAFGSDWAQLESGTFRFRDPLNKERRFLPLRLDDAPIKGSLAQFLYINWLPAARKQQYAKLLEACRCGETLRVDSATRSAGWRKVVTKDVVSDRDTRDDFSRKVKTKLAERVGMRCSNPACQRYTSGPHSDPNESINVGVAAHISAAARRGPRFDARLTPVERSSIQNGVWLCQNCAKLIDSDETRYPPEVLREWRKSAEQAALRSIETTVPQTTPFPAGQDRFSDALLRSLPTIHSHLLKQPSRRDSLDALAAVLQSASADKDVAERIVRQLILERFLKKAAGNRYELTLSGVTYLTRAKPKRQTT